MCTPGGTEVFTYAGWLPACEEIHDAIWAGYPTRTEREQSDTWVEQTEAGMRRQIVRDQVRFSVSHKRGAVVSATIYALRHQINGPGGILVGVMTATQFDIETLHSWYRCSANISQAIENWMES